jgi:putative aldouronate transport system substrate-binding protein
MKKVVSAGALIMLSMTLITGCLNSTGSKQTAAVPIDTSKFNATGYPVVNEPITLTMMSPHNPGEGAFENLALFKEMEKLTGIKLKFTLIPKQGYEERKNLAFASGDLPDFFYRGGITPIETELYGSQKVLIPLEDLIDKYAPNIKRVLKENPDIAKNITSSDGHIYALPSVNLQPRSKYMGYLLMEKSVFDQVGQPVPTNTDAMYAYLKSLKSTGRIPLSSNSLEMLRIPFLAAFGLMEKDWVWVNGDKVEFVPTLDKYKQYVTYMNRLYSEGLIDPQILTHTQQEFIAKGQSGRLGIANGVEGPVVFKIVPAESVKEKAVDIPPLTSPANNKAVFPSLPVISKGNFAITSKNKNPAETIRWVDFFWTARGALLQQQGILLSEDYMKDPTKVYLSGSTITEDDLKKANMTRQQFNNTYFTVFGGPAVVGDKEFNAKLQTDMAVTHYNDRAVKSFDPIAKAPYPDLSFTVKEIERLQVLSNDIHSYADEMHAKLVTGNYPLSSWDEYIKSFGKMKIDEYVKIYQDAYNRWKAAK